MHEGRLFPIAEFDGQLWREAAPRVAPGDWGFAPFGQAHRGTLSWPDGLPAEACPRPKERGVPPAVRPLAGLPVSTDVHDGFGLAWQGSAQHIPFVKQEWATATAATVPPRIWQWVTTHAPPVAGTDEHRVVVWQAKIGDRQLRRLEVDLTAQLSERGRCPLVRAEAWVFEQADGVWHTVSQYREALSCDGDKTATRVRPFGVFTVNNRSFVLTDQHYWEHVEYGIFEVARLTLVERLRVMGRCAA
jgi:hypothetical protein